MMTGAPHFVEGERSKIHPFLYWTRQSHVGGASESTVCWVWSFESGVEFRWKKDSL